MIAAAKKIQAPLINMHMHHGIHITLPDRKVQMYDRDFDVYMKHIRAFGEVCRKEIGDADLRISIENTDGFKGFERKAMEFLLENRVFALTWDIGHSRASHEADVPFLMEHEDRLAHFHIHDGTENPGRNHLALGDGEIDLNQRLSLARKHNSRCVLETKTIAALKKSVLWLEKNGWK